MINAIPPWKSDSFRNPHELKACIVVRLVTNLPDQFRFVFHTFEQRISALLDLVIVGMTTIGRTTP